MIWLTWRQFRAQALATLAVLIAAAVVLLITGIQMRVSYHADLATCAARPILLPGTGPRNTSTSKTWC